MTDHAREKHLLGAAGLSVLAPGLGQLYNGLPLRGATFFVIAFSLFVLISAFASAALWSPGTFPIAAALLVFGLGFYLFTIIDAIRGARRTGALEWRRYDRWTIYASLLVAGLGLTVLTGLTAFMTVRHDLQPFPMARPPVDLPPDVMVYAAPSSSMSPTLLDGDRVATAPDAYASGTPDRGDVVLYVHTGGLGAIYIQRIVGLPGDRTQIRDGILQINGAPATRSPLPAPERPEAGTYAASWYSSGDGPEFYEETFPDGHRHRIQELGDSEPGDTTPLFLVPDGHYFVLGDDRDISTDSRHPVTGFIPHENLRGQVLEVYWARDDSRIGTVVE